MKQGETKIKEKNGKTTEKQNKKKKGENENLDEEKICNT